MTGPTRGGNGRFSRSIKTARRDAEAAALRDQGLTYQQIADELDMGNKGDAYHAVERAIASLPREPAEAVRAIELQRLDAMYRAAMGVLQREHVTVSHGHVIRRQVGVERDADGIERLDMDGNPIPLFEDILDDGPILAAIDRLLKIQERRAKLLGLDAPAKLEVLTLDAIDAEIRKLQSELGVDGEVPAE
jgi:hypothetical protein